MLLSPKQGTFRIPLDKNNYSITTGVINSFNILEKIQVAHLSHKIGHNARNMDSLSILVSDDLEKVS